MIISLVVFLLVGTSLATAKQSDFGESLDPEARFPAALAGFDTAEDGVDEALRAQNRLLNVANYYSQKSYVPYIWGGGAVGDKKQCVACRKCVAKKGVSLKRRLQECAPCRRCGMDCSHFVHRVYQEAGLGYGYASTWELSRQNKAGLLRHYNMIDIGRDLGLAQPGDLLVYRRHVTMLSRVVSGTHGDFVHITRFRGDRLRLGGFRWDRDKNILNFRGRLKRILRHKSFFENPRSLAMRPLKSLFIGSWFLAE